MVSSFNHDAEIIAGIKKCGFLGNLHVISCC